MRRYSTLCLLLLIPLVVSAQTPIAVEPTKELKPTGSLGTCGYSPVPNEKPFFDKLGDSERNTGSFMEKYDIRGKNGKFVSWYGVVRGITRPTNSQNWDLLLEQKAFDGMTDCHIMLVSLSGYGDFKARVQSPDVPVPALALVRVYGRVKEENGAAVIQAEFVRVWPWMTFTFTDLGPTDKSNQRWRKDCKICAGGRIYRPYPTVQYYRDVLGDPDQYGIFLK